MAREEPEKPLKLNDVYAKAQDDLKFNADKGWETIKLCITLSSTLITVTLGFLAAINSLSINLVEKVSLILILAVFPIMMIKIVSFSSKNFDRECRRMYEHRTILMKIEDELPQRSDNRNFKDETKYIPRRWESSYVSPEGESNLFSTTEEFVKKMMQRKDKFYFNMKPVFSIFKIISYVLLLFISIIAFIVLAQGLFSFSVPLIRL